MFRIICFLIFVAFNGATAQSDCVPDPVHNVSLSLNYTLSWLPSTNCDNTDYIIYIHSEFELDHIYQARSPNLDVSFLPACERYRFVVVAHSQNVISAENYVDALIPAPPEVDLAINYFNVTQNTDTIQLEWSVDEQYKHCAHYFRVVILDNQIRDLYVDNTSLVLDDLIPCTNYQFTVRAIYNLAVEGPVAVVNHETSPARPSVPAMTGVSLGRNFVNITWTFPTYAVNPCPLSSLYVLGPPYYTNTFNINDTPERPQMSTYLGPLGSNIMYYFRVYLRNNAGASDPYQLFVQTLP